jgi:protein required for attachment to host cells
MLGRCTPELEMAAATASIAASFGATEGITAVSRSLLMILSHGTIVLAVDGGRMRLLRNRGQRTQLDLEILRERDFVNPPTHVLSEPQPGRRFESSSPSRSAYADTDVHQRREDNFCREALDEALAEAADNGELVLIAPPRVIGELRDHRERHPGKVNVREVVKDLTAYTPRELNQWLREHP